MAWNTLEYNILYFDMSWKQEELTLRIIIYIINNNSAVNGRQNLKDVVDSPPNLSGLIDI